MSTARVGAVMAPASALGADATVRDVASSLALGGPSFYLYEGQWQAVHAPMLIGFPATRRVIDLPSIPVQPIHPDDHLLTGLSRLDTEPLGSLPVVEGETLVGRLDRAAVLRALGSEVTDDLVLELSTLRNASLAIAHDMANALHVVRVQADLPVTTDSLREAVDHACLMVQRLRQIQLGSQPHRCSVDVGAAIERLLPVLTILGRPSTEVSFEYEGGVHTASCYPMLIDRALINLVANARDASEGKQSRTVIRVREQGSSVVVSVADDGPGIRPETMVSIFARGFTTKGSGHAGIGLSTLRRMAREIGGDLIVESVFGSGADFELHLPKA